MVSFILNGSEVTTLMGYAITSKLKTQNLKEHF